MTTASSVVAVVNHAQVVVSRVSTRHAVGMLIRKVVTLVEADMSTRIGPFPRPVIVRLVKPVFAAWLYRSAVATKAGVLRRDRHACAYCGGYADTVDHVLPASRGGRITWHNAVAACRVCNHAKADRTPAEAGMPLRFEPWEPLRIDLYG